MEDVTDAHNDLVDSHFELIEEMKQLRLKMADIEDRSRCNNIKFRGISEFVKNTELHEFAKKMMSDLLPKIPHQELISDRAHRLPKPQHISEKLPRDVIAQINLYHFKDLLIQRVPLPDPYAGIIFYSDQTKILHNHNIKY